MLKELLHKINRNKCVGTCRWDDSLDIVSMNCLTCRSEMGFCWLESGKLRVFVFHNYIKFRSEIEDQLKKFVKIHFEALGTTKNVMMVPTCDGDEMIF